MHRPFCLHNLALVARIVKSSVNLKERRMTYNFIMTVQTQFYSKGHQVRPRVFLADFGDYGLLDCEPRAEIYNHKGSLAQRNCIHFHVCFFEITIMFMDMVIDCTMAVSTTSTKPIAV